MTYGLQFHFYEDPAFRDLGVRDAFKRTRETRPELNFFAAVVSTLSNLLIRFKHVEMSVPRCVLSADLVAKYMVPDTDPNARLCISVNNKQGVTLFFKTLSSENYQRTLELQASHEQMQRIVGFADMHAGVPFEHPWYQTFLCPYPSNGRGFFCVQFVVMCAQQGGFFEHLNPSATSGDVLLDILENTYRAKSELTVSRLFNSNVSARGGPH